MFVKLLFLIYISSPIKGGVLVSIYTPCQLFSVLSPTFFYERSEQTFKTIIINLLSEYCHCVKVGTRRNVFHPRYAIA